MIDIKCRVCSRPGQVSQSVSYSCQQGPEGRELRVLFKTMLQWKWVGPKNGKSVERFLVHIVTPCYPPQTWVGTLHNSPTLTGLALPAWCRPRWIAWVLPRGVRNLLLLCEHSMGCLDLVTHWIVAPCAYNRWSISIEVLAGSIFTAMMGRLF